jgi:hypothetical protein
MTNRSGCEDCTGTTYSMQGIECIACDSPNVVNELRSSCRLCPAGQGPNAERSRCDRCQGTTYSTMGSCENCASPRVVNAQRTSCSQCPAAKQPLPDRTGCENCTGFDYSMNGVVCTIFKTTQYGNRSPELTDIYLPLLIK